MVLRRANVGGEGKEWANVWVGEGGKWKENERELERKMVMDDI